MLPLQDVLPSRTMPWMTLTLIAVSAVILVYELSLSTAELQTLVLAHGFAPARATALQAVSSLFIQPGLLATIANLATLWLFGDNVEDRLGPWRFLLLFFAGGLVAAAAAVGLEPESTYPLAGGVGGIAAVVGAHVSLFPRLRILVLVPLWRTLDLVEVPAPMIGAFWLLLQTLPMFDMNGSMAPPAVTLAMPAAGLAVGALAARLLCQRQRMTVDWWT